ncbi:TPA: hypothetical protein DDW35_09565 [Candidatus Sumerlaeota bacterium]|nr:hypothetical protein [Candidatus Sumerlaeota bacterium]
MPQRSRLIMGSLIAALLFATVLRFAIWHVYIQQPLVIANSDTPSYWLSAINLLHHGAFSCSPVAPFAPNIMRTPGYPAFLSLCILPFGESQPAVTFVQVLLSLLLILGIWQMGTRTFGRGAGLVGALLFACDIPTAICANTVMTETLFSVFLFALIATLFPTLGKMDKPNLGRLFLAGLLLSTLTLIRPVAQFFWIFLLPFLFFALPRPRRYPKLAGFLLFALLLPAGWTVRNWVQVGSPVYCSISAINLYTYRAAWDQARVEKRDFETLKAEFEQNVAKQHLSPAEEVRFMSHEGIRILFAHPGLTALQGFQGAVKMMLGISNSGLDYLWQPRDSWDMASSLNNPSEVGAKTVSKALAAPLWIIGLKLGSALQLLLVYTGIAFAFWKILCDSGWKAPTNRALRFFFWLNALAVLYFLLVSVGAETNSRFRVPIQPQLCLMSGLGWAYLIKKYPLQKKGV